MNDSQHPIPNGSLHPTATECQMCGDPAAPAAPVEAGDSGEELILCPQCRESYLRDGERDAFLDEAFWLELRLKRQPLPPEASPA